MNQKNIDIVKSTAPVLAEHGKAITTCFYQQMFTNHPELLNVFNHANQKTGRQQTALANTIYAAAQHIDQLEVLIPVVKQIAHKHRSLGVTAEQYPIVGKYLLLAIKEVLGDAATDEIINAWAEAYQAIANVFIQVEEEMYHETENQAGGWRYFKTLRVMKKVRESSEVISFYLQPEAGEHLPPFIPGQYISVRVAIPGNDHLHIRQYSLSNAPGEEFYRISVKREDCPEKGLVSNFLHDSVEVGMSIEISAPAGEFVLKPENEHPLVLISAGVGITPLMSMLKSSKLAGKAREITFIHAAKNSENHLFHEEVEAIALSHPMQYLTAYSEPTEQDIKDGRCNKEGFIDREWLKEHANSKEAQYYLCGGPSFMKTMYQHLIDNQIPASNIHYEFFGPAMEIA